MHFCIPDSSKFRKTAPPNPQTLTVSLEIYSSYALGEEAFVLVGFFFEERVVFLGLAAS